MMPVLRLMGLTVPTYLLSLLLALWAGLYLSARQAQRLGLPGDHVWDIGLYGLVSGVIGARLGYVLTHWSVYRSQPWQALSLTPGTFAPIAGVVVGLLVAAILVKRRGLPFAVLADALAPGAALALAIASLGAFLSGEAYGMATDVPWAVYQWDERRHPSQLYEMAAALGILAALWRRTNRPYDGFLAWLFVLLYGLTRLFLEAFRGDSWLLPGGVRGAQVLALAAALVALEVMGRTEDAAVGQLSSR
jgi:phosphatidylglycerol:prolipoprotein diacylglycerol transferase